MPCSSWDGWTVLMLAALLSFSAVAVAFNIIRLQILTMRDEIEVSKLIGATNRFIRRPFLYFGAIQGMVAERCGLAHYFAGIHLIDEQLEQLDGALRDQFSALSPFPGR